MAGCPRGHQKGLADPGMLRAASHQPLEHWGSDLSFLWKLAEIGTPRKMFPINKGYSQPKAVRRDSSGCPGPPEGCLSSTTQTLGLCPFLTEEEKFPSHLWVNGQNWDSLSKIPSIQGLRPDKSIQDKQVWLPCPLVIFFEYRNNFICQHLGESTKISQVWV